MDLSVLKLDRGRYHSTVHGELGSDPTRFRQDGLPFDGFGELCEKLTEDEQKLAQAMAREVKVEEVDGEQVHIGGEVNLERWAKGEVNYPAHKVFKTVRDRYSRVVGNFADAIEFLVQDPKGPKIIPPGLIGKKRLS